jgi:hypothetical protein
MKIPHQERDKNLLNDISIAPQRLLLCGVCFRLDIRLLLLQKFQHLNPLKANCKQEREVSEKKF